MSDAERAVPLEPAGETRLHEAPTAQPGPIQYESLSTSRKLVVAAFLVMALWYLVWRIGTFNPQAMGFSLVLYGAEVYGFITAALHLFMVGRLTRRDPAPPPSGLSVDVFVPTYNEPVELLRKTLLAAQNMRYPHRTWLLDDGNRAAMHALAEQTGCEYLARTDNVHGKAGNLNNALEHSTADYVVLFDADHAPKRDFLEKTLGFFRDPALGFVQTPQEFYNLDSYQHRWRRGGQRLWTEQSLFFRIIQRGKDRWNAAFFCGSCAVMRRSALDAIGGFATGTVTEDLHTSIRLHKQGYRSVYYAESLAFGLAPATVKSFLSQRIRWGSGAMQVWRKENILRSRQLTWAQKLNYMASMTTYFDGWQKAIFYLVPAVVLLTGVLPIKQMDWVFLAHFIPYYVLNFWAFEELGRGYGDSVRIEQYNMARYAAFIWSTLGMFKRNQSFKVTPKVLDGLPTKARYVVPQSAVLAVNASAIPVGIAFAAAGNGLTPMALGMNVFWAGINVTLAAAVLVFSLARPVRRREYRFPLPLPARVRLEGADASSEGNVAFALVRDISPTGFKVFVYRLAHAVEGQSVSGNVFLPDGPLSFKGTVEWVGADPSSGPGVLLGLRVQREEGSPWLRLDLFLFGSDLQWRLAKLIEKGRTPAEVIGDLFHGRRRRPIQAPLEWGTVVCRRWTLGRLDEIVGIVGIDEEREISRLIVFAEVKPDAGIAVRHVQRIDQRWTCYRVVDVEVVDSPVSPFYVCRLEADEELSNELSDDVYSRHDVALSGAAGDRGS